MMLSKRIIQLLLSSSPAIGSLLASSHHEQQQQPFGIDIDIDADLAAPSSPSSQSFEATKAPAYRADLLALHKSLISIPSTSGQEYDAGDFLVDYFISQGWNYEVQPVPPRNNTPENKNRFNVVAWPPASSSSSSSKQQQHRHNSQPDPKVLVTSHFDCVPPHIPYSITKGPVTKDTVLAGRCAVDAKGSVAAQLTAVHALLAAGALAPEDVMVLYVVGEEVSGDGMRVFNAANATRLHRRGRLRAAVFGEPTENKLACGHKGGMRCEVTARGRAGHSGYPWLGKSATEVLMRGLVRVLDADLGSSARYGNTTVNVGLLEGGVALNVIPAHAQASLMVRVALEPQSSGHEVVIQRMKDILASVDDEALHVDCPTGQGVTPCDCDVDGESDLALPCLALTGDKRTVGDTNC